MKCHCDSGKETSECCEPLLKGVRPAPTAEALMRSRYSAFCTRNLDYVQATTDPQALGDFDREGAREWMENSTFTKLEILSSSEQGTKGKVEFKAHFTMKDKNEIHHEVSTFRKQAGVWYFRDGRVVLPKS